MPELDQITSVEEVTPGTLDYRNLAEIPFVLGGQTFIVPPKNLRVVQKIKMDEEDIPNKSGSVKQAIGYESAQVFVELEVCHEEDVYGNVITAARDRVERLQRLFRESREALPKPHDLVTPITDMIGIRQVLIEELEAATPGDFDYIPVTMKLVEYESIKTQLDNQAKAKETLTAASDEGVEHIEGNEDLEAQLGYVEDQYEAGYAAGAGVETPATDTVTPPGVE